MESAEKILQYNTTLGLLPSDKFTRTVSWCQVHSLTHSHQSQNENITTTEENIKSSVKSQTDKVQRQNHSQRIVN